MNQSRGQRVIEAIGSPRQLPQVRDPLHEAFENYTRMSAELDDTRTANTQLRVENGALVAEVNMLRDSLERCDSDRLRLQSVSSTLLGQLMAINAVIAEAVKLSIKHGVEAAEKAKPEETADLKKAGDEARGIIERVEPTHGEGADGATLPANRL